MHTLSVAPPFVGTLCTTSTALAMPAHTHNTLARHTHTRTQVRALQLPAGDVLPGRLKTRAAGRLFVSPSGSAVATIDRNSLFVWAAGSDLQGKPLNLNHVRAYTVGGPGRG